MRRLLAAFGAACFCVSVLSAATAHAEPSRGPAKKQYLFQTSEKQEAAGKEKPRKVSSKRSTKRKTVIDKDGVVVGRLKTYKSTTGYPKAENPLSAERKTAGYSGLIQTYAKAYGVPVDLAHAVVRVESNFNPRARGSAGEIGLMQIKPATARMMGYRGGAKGLYDPETNIKFGMKYLAMAHDLSGGTTCGTILRYNAGHGAKRMNPVSKRYCGKVQSIID
ncbi:lytic transglycosylase domain-containing protein [Shinella yambaruensis]|uniref:Transglycosylase SLT domain-containing protein n=1 Tax=Shinella yambaruensis TaxID=415996 RepID=A0ABQ5ZNZ3_9HYPH|nr:MULTISPECIES: lytic transglycosylase domain-containing protein [Shinella]CAI0338357.1 Lytic transglycosylase [Rhizobiaceae bacterium]CAK7256803.1 Transglycosylase-like protein with SLT domain [Shinella sp. WSC3-e]MCJ8025333.1 lytic transglycosylase domain-containing protein [Shinella yambaruensis]MCO5138717.1 lytic transglycosylase domain-containing protein [Shinella sp.]MCU7981033.1 lytic transglycosylase domain-containing protein [Shinella yambaruensis]